MSKADKLLKSFVEYIDQPRASNKVDIVRLLKETLDYFNRKDQLAVGSVWVCDVDECLGGFMTHYKDEVCNVTKVLDDAVYIQHSINYEEEDEIPLEQFLACFIPVEKENY